MTKVRKKYLFFFSWKTKIAFEKFLEGFKKFDNYVVFVPSNIKIEDKFYKKYKENLLFEEQIINFFYNDSTNKKYFNRDFSIQEKKQILNQFERVTGDLDKPATKNIVILYQNLFEYIKKEKFNILFLESTPHLGYDFLIYKIFKKLNRKTYLFERNFFLDHYF